GRKTRFSLEASIVGGGGNLRARRAGCVPRFDEMEIPVHHLGKKFTRAIQDERVREVALCELGKAYCSNCNDAVSIRDRNA
ncbi:MAG: hypothetical protein KDA87_23450, partial [Planctomycetales bacterium]|nr:hypothetical protein [Planctomycetales bacterium]